MKLHDAIRTGTVDDLEGAITRSALVSPRQFAEAIVAAREPVADLKMLCRDFATQIMRVQDLWIDILALPEAEQADAWLMKFPVVQGTHNQNKLREFGAGADREAARRAFAAHVLGDTMADVRITKEPR